MLTQCNEATRLSYFASCGAFVSGEHPHFDTRVLKILYAVLNIFLKHIFNAGHADNFEARLNIPNLKLVSISFGYFFVSKHEGSQSQTS